MIDYETIRLNLPHEHNLREDLCRNLSVESGRLGHPSVARLFRLEEIRAREQNLWAAVSWKSDWHRRHYYGARRVRAGLELAWSYTNRFLWGYGERLYALLISTIVLAFLVLLGLFWAFGLGAADIDGKMHWANVFYMSVQTRLPVDLGLKISPSSFVERIVIVFGSLVGLVFAGLFVAYLLRWILRR